MAPNNGSVGSLAPDPGGVKSSSTIPLKEVQVDDKLYDAERLSLFHPGGELFVRAFAGR